VDEATRARLLALYDADERERAEYPDLRREELPHLVRQVDLLGRSGAVIFSRLDEASADAAIAEQVAYFRGLGQAFEWKAYAHDRPADLVQRLAGHGFAIDAPEAILVLDLAAPSAAGELTTRTVRRVEDPRELEAVRGVRERVDGADRDDLVARLGWEMTRAPRSISVYLADVNGVAAACGWIRFPPRSAFASLWGGSTVPGLRRRGLYTSLVAARAQEARARGYRYLTVDARPTSRPILERRGFQALTFATACTWQERAAE
jgi:hypothetical protein